MPDIFPLSPRRVERALANRLRRRINAGTNAAIERLVGVRTGGGEHLDEFGLSTENQGWYDATDWLALRRMFRAVGAGPSDVLLDYGAGKGRVVIAAALVPVGRAIGVELAPALVADAERNLAGVRARLRGPVEMVVADATRYEVPDDVTLVHMYSPFTGPVFAATVARILDSVDRRPRDLRLLYGNPFEHNFLMATRRFRPVQLIPRSWPPEREEPVESIVVYQVLPEPVDDPRGGPELGIWAGQRDYVRSMWGEYRFATLEDLPEHRRPVS